jgi:CRISPR-associated protein Csd2
MQLTFARSVSPVVPLDVTITRVAITKPEDAQVIEAEAEDGKSKSKTTEMGSRPLIPYGLYVGKGFFSAPFATQTGVKREDLELFWTALKQMWDLDHSASRGMMACRGLYVFSHENGLGNAPAHVLFDRITAQLKDGVKTPRRFEDYVVSLKEDDLPPGVTLTRLV